jgi:hypothetical protein
MADRVGFSATSIASFSRLLVDIMPSHIGLPSLLKRNQEEFKLFRV